MEQSITELLTLQRVFRACFQAKFRTFSSPPTVKITAGKDKMSESLFKAHLETYSVSHKIVAP